MAGQYHVTIMGNGFASILDRRSLLRGVYDARTGAYRGGDLALPLDVVARLIGRSGL